MYRPLMFILLLWSVNVQAQQHWLKGILLNKNTAEAVAGAVMYYGQDSAVTQPDGRFNLHMTKDKPLVKIIHPGYHTLHFSPEAADAFVPLFMTPTAPPVEPADSLLQPDTTLVNKPIKAYRNETYKKEKENPFIGTGNFPYTAFTLSSGYAAYNNVRRFLLKNKQAPAASIRIGEMLNYFAFDDPIPDKHPENPLQAYADISTCPWNQSHYLMRVAVQAGQKSVRSGRPRNIVLLIDVSGSMGSVDKLPLLKTAFKQLVVHLRPEDSLAIITYSGKTRLTLPPTSGLEKLKLLNVIDRLHSGGTTAGSKGIEKAFELARKHFIPGGNNRVILATDGDFNVGKSSDGEMKKQILAYRDWHIGLTCIGVGSGNYKDSKLETIADWGQGTFAYIDNEAEALRIFNDSQFQKMPVVARDVRLKILFDPFAISAFRLLGYDADGENARTAFRVKAEQPGGEMGVDRRMTAYIELIPTKDFGNFKDRRPVTLILQYNQMPEDKACLSLYQSSGIVTDFRDKNADWRFGVSVVLFGMLLQQSEYTGDGNYRLAEKIAREARKAVPEEMYKNYKKLIKKGEKLQ